MQVENGYVITMNEGVNKMHVAKTIEEAESIVHELLKGQTNVTPFPARIIQ